ncbi:DUF6301 family protein [Nocardia tengchongensis]|uniref:DUF6301 family protein n=1 Tax=Nocardia tengchongensis TaxID=2055889 RepID=UPI0036BD1315
MQADIEGAVSLARLAADFDWRWTFQNAEAFYRLAGWQVVYSSDTVAILQTVPGRQDRIAKALFDTDFLTLQRAVGEDLESVLVPLTDVGNGDASYLVALVDLFADLSQRFNAELGKPADLRPGRYATVRWDLPRLVLLLTAFDSGASLQIVNPTYQQWRDRPAMTSRERSGTDTLADRDRVDDTAPESWADWVAALTISLPRMGNNSYLRLRISEARIVVFEMGMYGDQLKIAIPNPSFADAGMSDPFGICASTDWTEYTEHQGESGWHRSVAWPARYQDYRSMAACATALLREGNPHLLPAAIEFEAWAYDDANTPDTSALVRRSS